MSEEKSPKSCTAALSLAGADYRCDWPVGDDGHHGGWGHTSQAAQAVWTGDDTEATTAAIRIQEEP